MKPFADVQARIDAVFRFTPAMIPGQTQLMGVMVALGVAAEGGIDAVIIEPNARGFTKPVMLSDRVKRGIIVGKGLVVGKSVAGMAVVALQ